MNLEMENFVNFNIIWMFFFKKSLVLDSKNGLSIAHFGLM